MVIISRNRLYLSPGIDGIRLALMILLFSIGADECGRIGYPNIPSEYFTRIVQWIFHLCNIKCAHKICFKLEKKVFHYSYVLYGVVKQYLSTAVLNVHKTYGPLREKNKGADQPVHPQWFRNNTASPKAVGGGTVGWQRPLFSRKKVLAEPLFYLNMLIWSGHFFIKLIFYLIIEAYLFTPVRQRRSL